MAAVRNVPVNGATDFLSGTGRIAAQVLGAVVIVIGLGWAFLTALDGRAAAAVVPVEIRLRSHEEMCRKDYAELLRFVTELRDETKGLRQVADATSLDVAVLRARATK